MSNRVEIVTCEFHNVFGTRKTGEVTKGYRIYDDYGMTYGNTWESMPEDDGDILRAIRDEADQAADTMIDFALEHGLSINGNFHESEEVQKMLAFSDEDDEDDEEGDDDGFHGDEDSKP
jgi:hypothetical protein